MDVSSRWPQPPSAPAARRLLTSTPPKEVWGRTLRLSPVWRNLVRALERRLRATATRSAQGGDRMWILPAAEGAARPCTLPGEALRGLPGAAGLSLGLALAAHGFPGRF